MTSREIANHRLLNQRIVGSKCITPGEVVAALGAMQAQDYAGALWAIGLRLPESTETTVEQAIADGTIIRTWPLRGTLHFVPSADVRWMLSLTAPRILAGSEGRHKQLELDNAVLAKSQTLIENALRGGGRMTRSAVFDLLERGGIPTTGQRGIHILQWLAMRSVLCFGPRESKQPTFVLLDEWAPKSRHLEKDEALAELARIYFTGHGPAALRDFIWWSGLKVSDAKTGIDMISERLTKETMCGTDYWMLQETPAKRDVQPDVHLLPGFDEYLLGYKNRDDVLDPTDANKIAPGRNGMFLSSIVINGRVAGLWKRTADRKSVMLMMNPFAPLKKNSIRSIAMAAERYGRYIGRQVELIWNSTTDPK
jgi:hypothetical protein